MPCNNLGTTIDVDLALKLIKLSESVFNIIQFYK